MFTIQYTPSKEASAQDYTAERCKELIRNGIGKPDLAVEILDIAPWQPAQQVAEHFQQGRVLLVGDAAHTMPPSWGWAPTRRFRAPRTWPGSSLPC
jgi:putative polyketide hydroxylase